MPSLTFRKPMTLVAMAGLLAVPNAMSDPVGVYAVIEKVVLSPDAANPTTIQIFGRFALTDQKPGDHYLPVKTGYLYYKINPANERATRAEWADLQALAPKAGTTKVPGTFVGFGNKWQSPPGRVRCATDAPADADVYPANIGVVKIAAERNSGWPVAAGLLDKTAGEPICTKGN